MSLNRKISISRAILSYLIFVGLISILSVGYLWISSERGRFEKEAIILRETYLQSQKQIIKREVHHALAFVEHMKSQTEARLRESVKARVYEAHAIAMNLYEFHHQKKSADEIKNIIREALRPIRFNKGRGYYFAFNREGIEELFAVKPEMEGTNMLSIKGGKGEPVVSDKLDIIRKDGEGFYRYTWTKPGEDGYFPKVAFLKLIEPLNWVVGTGEYLDDIERDIQEEVLQWISTIKFGNDGYVFAGQWDGLSLSGPATGKNMYDVTDLEGVKIVQALIKAARSGGGFVSYVLPKFEGRKHAAKLSYAVGVDDWQWYLGSGLYIDEIEDIIDEKKSALTARISSHVRFTVLILITLLLGIFLIVKLISNRIYRSFQSFSNFFSKTASDNIRIDVETLHFAEFFDLAKSANEMVEKRKKTEEALRLSHERFLTVLNSIDATIYVADMETHEILFMNKYMIESFGRDMTGEICWEAFRGETGPCDCCTNDQLIDDQGTPTGVCVWQGKNPKTGKWYVNYDRAIQWIDDRLSRIQIATDITEIRKLEEERRHSEERLSQAYKMEAIGTLAGGIAHDFNNILSPIIGNTELAQMDNDENSPTGMHLKEIMRAGLRAKELVQQILTFSRQRDQQKTPVRMGTIIKEIAKLIRSTIPTTIDIRYNLNVQVDTVLADPTQLHQVILNLCTNASHAMREKGGVLDIELDELELEYPFEDEYTDLNPGNYLRLSIRDSGYGMTPEVMEKIFEPYYTTKEVGEGTGMGLALVHGIVKSYGGDIRVESIKGQGSSFQVLLPKIEVEIFEEEEIAEGLPVGTERILLVDDEKAMVDVSSVMLKKLGYTVTTKTSSLEALEIFREDPARFDLVITDMTMPKMTGKDLAEEFMAIRSDIPIILCTGFSDQMSEDKARQMGIKVFLMKPIAMSDLAKVARETLDEN